MTIKNSQKKLTNNELTSKDFVWNNQEYCYAICNSLKPVISGKKNYITHFVTLGPGHFNSEAWIVNENLPDIEVIGYEPHPGRYNFINNEFPGTLYNMAVSSHSGYIDGWHGQGQDKIATDFRTELKEEAGFKNYKKVETQCTTIDSIIDKLPTNASIFLWMDIEGAEFDALRGALWSLLNKKIMLINVELNFIKQTINERSWLDIVELLRKFNYIAIGSSTPSVKAVSDNGCRYISRLNTDNPHADILFCFIPNHGVSNNYITLNMITDQENI